VDSPLTGDFCFQLSALGMRCHRKNADLCYYVPLPATHDLFLKSLTSSLRCNYKRRWRVLEREGNVEFVSTTDPAEIARQFPELVELHRLRFVQRQERSMFAQPRVLAFHAKVLERLKSRPIARLLVIRNNGEAVAALYGFSAGNAFQFYQCGMHPEWKHKGVGQMMIGRAIEESIRLGHAEFDFLRGGEAYKAQWTDEARSTVTFRLFDNRWKGRYAEAVWRASVVARKWKAALREKRAGLNKPPETHVDD
jgi:CelD/BcsL family acetyltransferase involved in cellulose biosynthesis